MPQQERIATLVKSVQKAKNANSFKEIDPIVFQYMHPNQIWCRKAKKDPNSGAVKAGDLDGFYNLKVNPKIQVFFKKDPVASKNIGEFVASRVMRAIAQNIGFNPNAVAQVELAFTHPESKPNRDGKNVYVASVVYPDFLELYKDAYLAFRYLPQYEELRNNHPEYLELRFPENRPRLLDKEDPIIKLMIENGRYQGLNCHLQLSSSVDDPDVHFGNVGVVPREDTVVNQVEPSKTIEIYEDGTMAEAGPDVPKGIQSYKVFTAVDTVRIDFGAAFGDDRFIERTYDKNRANKGLISTIIDYHPSKQGPPPYALKISSLVRNDPSSLFWLSKIAQCEPDIIEQAFNSAMQEVMDKYQRKPLLEFAKRIGLKISNKRAKDISKDDLQKEIVKFLTECFIKYQESARDYESKFKLNPNMPDFNLEEKASIIPGTNPLETKVKINAKIMELLNKCINRLEELDLTIQNILILKKKLFDLPDDKIPYYEDAFMETLNTMQNVIWKDETQIELAKLNFNTSSSAKTTLKKHAEDLNKESPTLLALLKLANSIDTLPKNELRRKARDILEKETNHCSRMINLNKDSFMDKEDEGLINSLNQLSGTIDALKDYQMALDETGHETLKQEKENLLNLRYEKVTKLLTKSSPDTYLNMERVKSHIVEATNVIKHINTLENTVYDSPSDDYKYLPVNEARRVFKSSVEFYKESGKSAAKLLMKSTPNFECTELLSETVLTVNDSIKNPLKADIERLEINANELESKSSFSKKLSGTGFMVVSALTALAATVIVLASFALIKPTIGLSLGGLPIAKFLYGASVGFFTTGSALLFSGRSKQMAKKTLKTMNSIIDAKEIIIKNKPAA